jgi:hypothetical protein
MSWRDDAIVAWHEVPGRAPPQKIRPVGYGVNKASRSLKGRQESVLHHCGIPMLLDQGRTR